ncbi:MAG: nitrite/sulfite reductase [Sandaracinus sp.]|nr:nitrite/sulfite reductase [Sandaracinus sp.]
MSVPTKTWKSELEGRLPEAQAREIDVFEGQIALRKQGKIDERLFAETRLRRGVYGQRYDNGLRDDGTGPKALAFPSGDLTKGPETVWDAPGMQRIKVPYGKLSSDQLEVLAELAEELSDAILHVTTRQDIQLHYIHIEDAPDMHRRLGAVGLTTREACGNSVRNITACQFAGVCNDESFDVTPYAEAMTRFLLGHPDVQDFGRKFKIAFSGCDDHPCGLVTFHDLGAVAFVEDGKRYFKVVVGGGLGAVPVTAKVLAEKCPEEELLPLTQAVSRVFARLGEKQSRARARVKFLVQKVGIEEFKRLVAEEREALRDDPRWTEFLGDLSLLDEKPIRPGGELPLDGAPEGFRKWAATNLRPQAQRGYYVATLTTPLGDVSSDQARVLADLARRYTGDAMRLTVEQNFCFRWLSGTDALAFWQEVEALGLGDAGASTLADPTSCPGTDTCKLGISSSRGLTGELRKRLPVLAENPVLRDLRVKTSGCFNSCSQHHAADIGFLGVSRNVGGRKVPHFNVVLGGQWSQNAKSYGLVVGAVPSKNAPKAVELLTQTYAAEREGDESFQAWIARIGKGRIRTILEPVTKPPTYEEDPSFYRDWGDPREYSTGDLGIGECAGEVVPWVEFGLTTSEQEQYEAQDLHDAGQHAEAAAKAFASMVTAAKALVRHLGGQVRDDAGDVVEAFRTHLYDTQVFFDPFAKGKFAEYFLRAWKRRAFELDDPERVHELLDEARLFLEACHACYQRVGATPTPINLLSPQTAAPAPAE